MAEHIWSVLCEKMLTEPETNVVSLISIVETITIEQKLEDVEQEMKDAIGLGYPMLLISWWVRSDKDKGEAFELRARWKSPRGKEIPVGEAQRFSLEGIVGARIKFKLPGIPWDGAGVYWLHVDERDEGKRWSAAARIRVQLDVQDPKTSP